MSSLLLTFVYKTMCDAATPSALESLELLDNNLPIIGTSLFFVAGCCSVLKCAVVCCSVLQCVAVCCSVLQCAAVCCSVLQCVAVCCSVPGQLYTTRLNPNLYNLNPNPKTG